jgi:hypothetical protein
MAELVVIEQHPDFSSASRRAKELAERYTECASIERSSMGWAVLASPVIFYSLNPDDLPWDEETADLEDYSASDYDDYYYDDYQKEVFEEFQSDQDNWARSEEGGWFYDD